MYAAGIFFSKYVICDQERDGGTQLFGGGDIQQKGKVQAFGLAGRSRLQFPPLVGHRDLPIRKTQMRVVGLLILMILKRVSESFFCQSKKLTACKVKDEKEVTNLNLLHILLK